MAVGDLGLLCLGMAVVPMIRASPCSAHNAAIPGVASWKLKSITTSPPAMTLRRSSSRSICPTTCKSGRCDAQARSIWPIRPLAPVMMIFVVFNGWSVMVLLRSGHVRVRLSSSSKSIWLAEIVLPFVCQNRLHAVRIAGKKPQRRDERREDWVSAQSKTIHSPVTKSDLTLLHSSQRSSRLGGLFGRAQIA